ncbi:MAG: hypothetical protein OQL09_06220 [Gammaproteobacteria bacterium]|nr:hypothetical protein [Gammaproteobacteria bacterium]
MAASIGLTACSDSSSSDPDPVVDPITTVTLSGKVADGYLNGATVCLDLNENQVCDTGEPSATSTAGGNYSLDATQAQIDAYPVVVKVIANQTIDEDTGNAVTKAYTLSAPAGKGAFVSPLTTMVQAQVDATGESVDVIESQILTSMGQDSTAVSLFDDYVVKESDATDPNQASYERMHQVAQVTAVQIADNLELIDTAIADSTITIDLATALDSVINEIVALVIAELAAIDAAIDDAVTAGTYDPDTVAATTAVTVDTGTIEAVVDAAEAEDNATIAAIQTMFESGLYWIYAKFESWGNEFEYGSLVAAGSTITEIFYEYDFSTDTWIMPASSVNSYVLQADGSWLAVDDWNGATITYDSAANTATIDGNWGAEVFSNVQESDWSGLNIKTSLASISADLASIVNPAAVFSAGAKAYSGQVAYVADNYDLEFWDDCAVTDPQYTATSGNCNTVIIDWNTGLQATALADLLSATAWVDDGISWPNLYWLGGNDTSSLQMELVGSGTSGTVNYYLEENCATSCTLTSVGTGSWNIIAVNGTSLLMVDHPDTLMTTYSSIIEKAVSVNSIFAVHEGVVRKGRHYPAGSVETLADGDALTNQQAQTDILAAIDATLVEALVAPPTSTATFDCSYVSGLDANGDPLTLNSYTDFEAVITACGGAQAITDADIIGTWVNTYVDGGTWVETNLFNADGTGLYTETLDGVVMDSLDLTWSVANNRVTVLGNQFIDTMVVLADGSQKIYSEDGGWGSDLVLDGTQDGVIWADSAVKQ